MSRGEGGHRISPSGCLWAMVRRSPSDIHTSRSPSDIHTRKLASYSWTKGAASSESEGYPAFPAIPAQLHLQNSTGRSPISVWRFFRSCTDRMAQVTPKNSTGRSPIFILALFRSCTDRMAQVTPKNRTGCSPIFISVMYRSNGSSYP